MKILKTYWPILAGVGILLLFFVTRLISLTALPIFTDEAIYIRWAQIAGNDANWRFISLTDGKQPLYVWIAMILVKFINDPLLAGRLVSVGAGFGSLIGIFLLTNELFKNRKLALFASLFYVLYPFALVYDRLALYDSLVSLFIIWALYFEVLLVRYVRLDIALILGMIMGLGMLTKTNTNFAMLLLPFSLLLFHWHGKEWKKRLGTWIGFAAISVIIANAMYLILRLSPFYHIIEEKNYVFVYPLKEWLAHPFTYFAGNFGTLFFWLADYLTWPCLIAVFTAFIVSKKYFKENLLLFFWFILPFLAFALFGRVIYPRHILFATIPLLIMAAYAISAMISFNKKLWFKVLIAVVFLSMFFVKDYLILTDFAKAPIPTSDLNQLVREWPAGGGVAETVAFLTEKAKTEKIYVGTGGTFGLMPAALEIYLHDNPNIITKGFWPVNETPPKEVLEASKSMPTYFVLYQSCPSCSQIGFAPPLWPATPVLRIKKMAKETYYTLYQITPQ